MTRGSIQEYVEAVRGRYCLANAWLSEFSMKVANAWTAQPSLPPKVGGT